MNMNSRNSEGRFPCYILDESELNGIDFGADG
jgi:hypothetical protein